MKNYDFLQFSQNDWINLLNLSLSIQKNLKPQRDGK